MEIYYKGSSNFLKIVQSKSMKLFILALGLGAQALCSLQVLSANPDAVLLNGKAQFEDLDYFTLNPAASGIIGSYAYSGKQLNAIQVQAQVRNMVQMDLSPQFSNHAIDKLHQIIISASLSIICY
jgi:hypothetical protein